MWGECWRSDALALPAPPPASRRTSERTFVWAAKLNLPPSCQGIGKAVRGEEGGAQAGCGGGERREGGKEGGGRERALPAPRLAAPRRTRPDSRPPSCGPAARPPGSRSGCRPPTPGARPGAALALRPARGGRGGRGGGGRKSLQPGEGQGPAARRRAVPRGGVGGAGRRPRGLFTFPSVFETRGRAGCRPPPAAPGQSPVKIWRRTMAGGPSPAPPRPRAGFLDGRPQRRGDVRPLRAPPTSRPRSPRCPPCPDAGNATSCRARPPPRLAPAPPGPPPPETKRKKERGDVTFVFAARARVSPRGSPLGRGSPVRAQPSRPRRLAKTHRAPVHTPTSRRAPLAPSAAQPRAGHTQTT